MTTTIGSPPVNYSALTDNRWGECIITVSGKRIFFNEPEKNEYDIGDIAHGLSHVCRWAGHTRTMMTVAQHSCIVADLLWLDKEIALQGLMHDAAEAYLGDVTNPLKSMLPDYQKIEQEFDKALANSFNYSVPFHSLVKHADRMALAQECRDLFNGFVTSLELPDPPDKPLVCWAPHMAREQFMYRYFTLRGDEKQKAKIVPAALPLTWSMF